MNRYSRLLYISLLITAATHAQNSVPTQQSSFERLQLTLSVDNDGNTAPTLFMPYYWSDTLFSGIGYSTLNTSETSFTGDINAIETSSQEILSFNLLQYQKKGHDLQYSLGLAVEYAQVTNNALYSIPTQGVNLNLQTDIQAWKSGISGDLAYRDIAGFISLRMGGYLYPYTRLDVTHDLNHFTTNSKERQEVTYQGFVNTFFESGIGIDLSLTLRYQLDAYSYRINQLDTSLQPSGTTKELQTSYITWRSEVKLLLSRFSSEGMYPMLGYAREQITSDNGNGSSSDTYNLLLFGFERPF